jgi:hypothetical protein
MEISLLVLRNMLADAAELGAKTALKEAGLIKPWITRAEANRRFGEGTVNRWIAEDLIKLRKSDPNSAKKFISIDDIEAVNKAFKTPLYNFS